MNSPEDLLSQLNPAQRAAVETIDGPLLIIAGAGSGKTRVITYRIAHMLQNCNVPPWNLLAVTFTNKAAGEMRRRVINLIGHDPGPSLQVSTFHSACARLLRKEAYKIGLTSSFTICDTTDQIAVIKDCMKSLGYTKDDIAPGLIQSVISQSKMRLLGPKDYADAADTEIEHMAAEAFTLYQKRLRENDAVDFDDLLVYVVKLFDESPDTLNEYRERFRYLMVDEYQDTNHVQYRLVESLAREHRNICVVGDEDQSIYSWRGAEITNLLEFQKQFPEARIVKLEQNYRSTQSILAVADVSIVNNKERLGKELWTDRTGGGKPTVLAGYDGSDEARLVVERIRHHHAEGYRYRDMAIFYRANFLSRPFEDSLRKADIPYRVIGGIRFYDRAEVKDLMSYLGLIENPDNAIQLLRVLNRPRRGIGDKSIESLTRLADQHSESCWRAIARGLADGAFSKSLAGKLKQFREMVEAWRKLKRDGASVPDLYEAVLKDTEYEKKLGDPSDFEVINRKENLAEFGAVIAEFDNERSSGELCDFLEQISLQSSVDDLDETDAIALMTLHCAKGLEYKVAFVVALEEKIFPNPRAETERGNVEEERRLFYVGVTRAEDILYLTRAESRYLFRETVYNAVSRFLLEVPPALVDEVHTEPPESKWSGSSYDRYGFDRRAQGRDKRRGGRDRASQRGVKRETVFDQPKRRKPPSSKAAFQPGQRVRHPIFGEGEVSAVEAAAAGRSTVVVTFDDGETRAFVAKFAGLKPL